MDHPLNLADFLPTSTLEGLRTVDRRWHHYRQGQIPWKTVVTMASEGKTIQPEFDVVICGGTLGILLGASLQHRGLRVAVIERGALQGRAQEWNISRHELQTFRDLGLLSAAELEQAIATEYNPARLGFSGGKDLWVRDVLNVGVCPVTLLALLKEKFLQAGGSLFEHHCFQGATLYLDGVEVQSDRRSFRGKLLLDAMGNFSPLVAQVRQGEKPDGVCLVVGSCAQGYGENTTGDLIYTFTPITHHCQYFWEAFPARDGRTTYLFTYGDAEGDRPSLEFLMAEYLRLLPEYQGVSLEQLDFQRFLFSFFPAYKNSPLHFPWPRMLAVGDSSGAQSPVSFGGFGSMVRHLARLTEGIGQAIAQNQLNASDLAQLQPYQPNLGVTWLFQQTMSVPLGKTVNPQQINNLMNGVFQVMDRLGPGVMKPFLQDVIQWGPLSQTLPRVDPRLVFPLLPQIGMGSLLDWSGHYGRLALYTLWARSESWLQPLCDRFLPQTTPYWQRKFQGFRYGAGLDYSPITDESKS